MEKSISRPSALPKKLTLRQLCILEWLLAAPKGSRRFLISTEFHLKLYETKEARDDGLFPVTSCMMPALSPGEGPELTFKEQSNHDIYKLSSNGFLKSFGSSYPSMPAGQVTFTDKVEDIYIPGKWNFRSVYHEIGGEWVADWFAEVGSAMRLSMIADIKFKTEAVTRRAIFGHRSYLRTSIPAELAKLLPNFEPRLPAKEVLRPVFVATIYAETAQRFKIRDVHHFNGSSSSSNRPYVKEDYVEREFLLLDNATDADVAKLKAFDAEYVQEIRQISDDIYAEIFPIIARMNDRLVQKQGQHDDTLNEMLRALEAAKKG